MGTAAITSGTDGEGIELLKEEVKVVVELLVIGLTVVAD